MVKLFGFGASLDDTCHSGDAAWASIKHLSIKLVKEQNTKKIIIIRSYRAAISSQNDILSHWSVFEHV